MQVVVIHNLYVFILRKFLMKHSILIFLNQDRICFLFCFNLVLYLLVLAHGYDNGVLWDSRVFVGFWRGRTLKK